MGSAAAVVPKATTTRFRTPHPNEDIVMRHKILAIINRRLMIAEVTVISRNGNHFVTCPKCGERNQLRDGWYGCWPCEIEYSVDGLQRIERAEREAAEYAGDV